MRFALLTCFVLISAFASAQRYPYHGFEAYGAFKSIRVDRADFRFSYLKLSPDTGLLVGNLTIKPGTNQFAAGGGFEINLFDNWLLNVKGDYNINNYTGGGLQLGAAYRLRLNYFMRLIPSLSASWQLAELHLGSVSPSERPFILNDVRFWEETDMYAVYRINSYGLMPAVAFVADINKTFEFRYTLFAHMGLFRSHSLQIRGEVAHQQTAGTKLNFDDENLKYTYTGDPSARSFMHLGGIGMRLGIGVKLWR